MNSFEIAMLVARYPPFRAGTELACQRLSQLLVHRRHHVTVLTENVPRDFPLERQEDGIRVLRFRSYGRPPFSSAIYCLKTFWFLWRNSSYDLFHAHMLAGPAMLALAVGRLQKKPVLVKIAGAGKLGDVNTSRRSLRGRIKLRLFRRWAEYVVAVSPAVAQEMREIGIGADKIHLIPNGIDTEAYYPATDADRQASRRRLGLLDPELVALYVGRWTEAKGLEVLLAAWEQGLKRPDFAWRLMMVIGGDFHPSEAASAQIARLGSRLKIYHNAPDIIPYYHASDLAILLSEGEGLSNFLLESMACGVPTLVSEAAAVDGIAGADILPNSSDPAALCLAELLRVQRQPQELRDRGRQVRQGIEAAFSLEAVARSYEKLYALMTGRAAGSA